MSGRIIFPSQCITGSLGDLALELSKGTEVSPEFVFVAALTYLGAMASGQLSVDVGLESLKDTRLYSVLLGKSYSAKKSSALQRVKAFFGTVRSAHNVHVLHGAGSAEGLCREFTAHSRILLAYDELRAFVEKTSVQGATLLQMVASLFEQYYWDNSTKSRELSFSVQDARLSLVGCSTLETYEHIWTREAIAIGLPNRLFVVLAGEQEPVPWPSSPDAIALQGIRQRVQSQLSKLPISFPITDDAKKMWAAWYRSRDRSSVHTSRLDTIGFRLMPLFALTMDKTEVDIEVMELVLVMLRYEFDVRVESDPIDADNTIALLESKIRRQLSKKGPLTDRELRQAIKPERYGIWAWKCAVTNLRSAGEILQEDGKFRCVDNSVDTLPKSA
jgi:hypothetical protein